MVLRIFSLNTTENKVVIKAKTYDNPFCQRGYIETPKKPIRRRTSRRHLNGEFVNKQRQHTGTIASTPHRRNPLDKEILFVGLDS
jgi:hypothetical protein